MPETDYDYDYIVIIIEEEVPGPFWKAAILYFSLSLKELSINLIVKIIE